MDIKIILTRFMKSTIILGLCFCTTFLLIAKPKAKKFYLEEPMKPVFIAVNDKYCFIGERFAILQYSLKDLTFVKKFGGKGQGPGEFPVILDLHATDQYLIVSSLSRVYLYSKEGEYITEKKTTAWSTRFDKKGNQFLGGGSMEENNKGYNTINLLNEDLTPKKLLYRYEKTLQTSGPINPMSHDPYFSFIGNKILASTVDDQILLFNCKGERNGEINLNLKEIPIPSEHKKKYLDSLKSNPRKKMLYGMIKDRIKMPEHFPVIQFLRVSGNLIYVIGFQQNDDDFLCLVLADSGKELKRCWIPLPPSGEFVYPFAFHNGSYYHVKDDMDKEKWVLVKEHIFNTDDLKKGASVKE